jgi:hypothetical protein
MLGILLLIVCVGGLVIAPIAGIMMLRKRSQIKNTPVSTVLGLQEGLAAVQGKAVPYAEATAPFSGTPCAYCEYKAEQLTRCASRHSLPEWETLAEERTEMPFYVEDGSGRVLVSTREAFADLSESYAFTNVNARNGAQTAELSPAQRQSMEQRGIPCTDAAGAELPLSLSESRLDADAPVYVLGTATRDPEAIRKAFGFDPAEVGEEHEWVIDGGGDQVYIGVGDSLSIGRGLLWTGLALLVIGPPVGLLAGLILYLSHAG